MECWGRSSSCMAKDPLGRVIGSAASQGRKCSCCLELLGCSRHGTQPAYTPQGTAPCRTASPHNPAAWGSRLAENSPSALPPASVPWAVLRILWGPWSLLHNHLHLPRGSRHGASSSPVPGSPLALPGGTDLEESPTVLLSAGLGRASEGPIKVLLCRSARAGVWTCWAGSRQGWCPCCWW